MSEHLNGGLRMDDTLYGGRTIAEWNREEQAVNAQILARQNAKQVADRFQAQSTLISTERAERADSDRLSLSARRALLREASGRHVGLSVAHRTELDLLQRVELAHATARQTADRYGRVGDEIASWISERVLAGEPTAPLPADLVQRRGAAADADAQVEFLSDELDKRRASVAAADAQLQQSDSLRAELARRVLAACGDDLAIRRRALLADIAALDTAQVSLLACYPGGQQIPVSLSARAALSEPLAVDIKADETLRQFYLDAHSALLDDADAPIGAVP